jgi:hypothetical protein
MAMRFAGIGLLLAAICTACGDFFFSKGARMTSDTFSEIDVTYAIAGIMAAGGVALLLFGSGPHPVDEEYEDPDLRLVG